MLHSEKLQIYDMLKKASDSFYGFGSPSFPPERPDFIDDPSPDESEKTQAPPPPEIEIAESGALTDLARQVVSCSRCGLCAQRRNAVPGMGVTEPFVLVVGEGPGEQEDARGLPFVGPAGQLLDKMLAAISLYRNANCFITNIVKCRPPMNRTPTPEEAAACMPFLRAQVKILKPKAILAAGTTAIKTLLNTKTGIMRLHGKLFEFDGIPLLATYHPSLLLRYSDYKRAAWEDLKIFRAKLLEINPEYASIKNAPFGFPEGGA